MLTLAAVVTGVAMVAVDVDVVSRAPVEDDVVMVDVVVGVIVVV